MDDDTSGLGSTMYQSHTEQDLKSAAALSSGEGGFSSASNAGAAAASGSTGSANSKDHVVPSSFPQDLESTTAGAADTSDLDSIMHQGDDAVAQFGRYVGVHRGRGLDDLGAGLPSSMNPEAPVVPVSTPAAVSVGPASGYCQCTKCNAKYGVGANFCTVCGPHLVLMGTQAWSLSERVPSLPDPPSGSTAWGCGVGIQQAVGSCLLGTIPPAVDGTAGGGDVAAGAPENKKARSDWANVPSGLYQIGKAFERDHPAAYLAPEIFYWNPLLDLQKQGQPAASTSDTRGPACPKCSSPIPGQLGHRGVSGTGYTVIAGLGPPVAVLASRVGCNKCTYQACATSNALAGIFRPCWSPLLNIVSML